MSTKIICQSPYTNQTKVWDSNLSDVLPVAIAQVVKRTIFILRMFEGKLSATKCGYNSSGGDVGDGDVIPGDFTFQPVVLLRSFSELECDHFDAVCF